MHMCWDLIRNSNVKWKCMQIQVNSARFRHECCNWESVGCFKCIQPSVGEMQITTKHHTKPLIDHLLLRIFLNQIKAQNCSIAGGIAFKMNPCFSIGYDQIITIMGKQFLPNRPFFLVSLVTDSGWNQSGITLSIQVCFPPIISQGSLLVSRVEGSNLSL